MARPNAVASSRMARPNAVASSRMARPNAVAGWRGDAIERGDSGQYGGARSSNGRRLRSPVDQCRRPGGGGVGPRRLDQTVMGRKLTRGIGGRGVSGEVEGLTATAAEV